jgi:hypothetical protein
MHRLMVNIKSLNIFYSSFGVIKSGQKRGLKRKNRSLRDFHFLINYIHINHIARLTQFYRSLTQGLLRQKCAPARAPATAPQPWRHLNPSQERNLSGL